VTDPELHPRVAINGVYDPRASIADDLRLCVEAGAAWLALPVARAHGRRGADVVAQVRASPVGITTVCHPRLATLDDASRWPEELEAARRTIRLAADLGADSVYITTGGRGSIPWSRAADAFVPLAADLVGYASSAGVRLLLEPTLPVFSDLSIVHTLGDLVALADRSGVGVCLDLAGAGNDSSYETSMAAAVARTGLVQLADLVPGDRGGLDRSVPGDGTADLDTPLRALAEKGYPGHFDLELRGPRIDAEGRSAAFRRAVAWTSDVLEHHGLT
jgi:sugar phosphate isomerase/epimerase